mmetsp:Transcript_35829/g.89448  ORF Transcript_35829/g.89448 Transcript_35829/m.89448 type:complete len:140 (-) Transcript_35829:1888-2307(-)
MRGITLTKEHKAILAPERRRIERSGGYVSPDGRLLGRLEVSRSFGDRQFKKAGCTSVPDVVAFELTPSDRLMLLGCDGFWGVFGATEAANMAAKLVAEGKGAKFVTNRLLNEAIIKRNCKDNCTVLLVTFDGGGGGGKV